MFHLMTRLECVVQGRHAAGSVYLIRDRENDKTRLRCTECMNFVGKPFDEVLPSNPKYALKDGWVNGCKRPQLKILPPPESRVAQQGVVCATRCSSTQRKDGRMRKRSGF